MIEEKKTQIDHIHKTIENKTDREQKEINDFDRFFAGLSEEDKNKRIKNLFAGMQKVAENISIVIDDLQKKIVENFEKIIPLFESLVKTLGELYPAYILGKKQFVWWKMLPEETVLLVKKAENEEKKADIIQNWMLTYNPDDVIAQLNKNTNLAEWPVYNQSIYAYNNNMYDLAALGLTACFDRILSLYSGDSTHKIGDRIDKVVQRFINHEREGTKPTNEDYNSMYLYETVTQTVAQFSKTISFTETEPQYLNRHWIMHGRMKKKITKLDCIKLINLLNGVIMMKDVE